MLVQTEKDGFRYTVSDCGKMIRKKGTDEFYSEAWDLPNAAYEYEETDIDIEIEEENSENANMLHTSIFMQ